MEDEFSSVADLIPDGAIPVHAFRLVEYLDEDGDPGMRFKVDGDVMVSQTVGLLEMAKHAYLNPADIDD